MKRVLLLLSFVFIGSFCVLFYQNPNIFKAFYVQRLVNPRSWGRVEIVEERPIGNIKDMFQSEVAWQVLEQLVGFVTGVLICVLIGWRVSSYRNFYEQSFEKSLEQCLQRQNRFEKQLSALELQIIDFERTYLFMQKETVLRYNSSNEVSDVKDQKMDEVQAYDKNNTNDNNEELIRQAVHAIIKQSFDEPQFESLLEKLTKILESLSKISQKEDDLPALENDVSLLTENTETEGNDVFYEGKNEFYEGKNEFYEGKNEFYEGKNEFYEGKNEFYEGKNELYEGKNELYEGKNEFYDGKNKFYDGKNELYEGKNELYEGRNEFYDRKNEFYDGKNELYEGKNEFYGGKNEFYEGKNGLYEGKNGLYEGQNEFYEGKNEFYEGKNELHEGKNEFYKGKNECYENKTFELGYEEEEKLGERAQIVESQDQSNACSEDIVNTNSLDVVKEKRELSGIYETSPYELHPCKSNEKLSEMVLGAGECEETFRGKIVPVSQIPKYQELKRSQKQRPQTPKKCDNEKLIPYVTSRHTPDHSSIEITSPQSTPRKNNSSPIARTKGRSGKQKKRS